MGDRTLENCNIMTVTSCKGGVGKSTIAANLAAALAEIGYRVLLVDCDFTVRSLDLILGLEDRAIYDVYDVISGSVSPDKALIKDPRSENLFFLCAPYGKTEDMIEEDRFGPMILNYAKEGGFDYIILDTPGDIGKSFQMAASVSDSALVVSTNQPTSLRAAERTGAMLAEKGVGTRKLVINCFDTGRVTFSAEHSLTGLIDETSIQLIGIIPFDIRVMEAQSRRELVFSLKDSNVPVAYRNIAQRLNGIQIPLFTGFRHINRKQLMTQLR